MYLTATVCVTSRCVHDSHYVMTGGCCVSDQMIQQVAKLADFGTSISNFADYNDGGGIGGANGSV